MNIGNKLVDYKMVYFRTDNKVGNLAKIILNRCEIEVEKFKKTLGDTDVIVVYDYDSAPFGVNIKMHAYEK